MILGILGFILLFLKYIKCFLIFKYNIVNIYFNKRILFFCGNNFLKLEI